MITNKNEHGYALLTVLLLVLLFTTLGMGLLAMNINASKQFDIKEEQVQARHQAEMGFLHFNVAVEKEVTSLILKNDSKEINKDESASNLCANIKKSSQNINAEFNLVEDNKYYQIQILKCGENGNNYDLNDEEELELEILSTGTSLGKSKKITGKTTISLDMSEESKENNTKPEYPNPAGEVKEYNEMPRESDKYSKVAGPVKLSGGTYKFKDSLVITKAPNEKVGSGNKDTNTLGVKPGSKPNLIVGKDLYIGGNFYSQNHACVMVKGNVTILGPIHLGNKTNLIVYGNAYFKQDPTLANGNANIYVAGKTFINSEEVLSETSYFNNYANIKAPCDIPTGWPKPDEPSPNYYKWTLKDNLDPFYE